MSGLRCGAACQFAGATLDDFTDTLIDDVNSHAARLGIAAERYQQADEEFG